MMISVDNDIVVRPDVFTSPEATEPRIIADDGAPVDKASPWMRGEQPQEGLSANRCSMGSRFGLQIGRTGVIRMVWIRTVSPDEAEGRTREVLEKVIAERGHIANIFSAQSLEPETLGHHLDMYMEIMMGKGPLSRDEREMIAVVVSAANRCAYCAVHHSEALEFVENDHDALRKLLTEFVSRHESPREKALLAYAAKLTLSPKDISEDDIKDLRDVGLTDQDILRANLIASYFNFSNRIALGLGVELEEGRTRTYKY